MTAEILAPTDALGDPVRFVLLPGRRFDTAGVPPPPDGVRFDALIADEAFDSGAILADPDARGAELVISRHPRRASPRPIDADTCKWRHPIGDFFCKLREPERVAMRRDETDGSFSAMIHPAAAIVNSR